MHMPDSMKCGRRPFQQTQCDIRASWPFRLKHLLLQINMLFICMMLLGIMPSTARAELDIENCVGAWLDARSWVDGLTVPEKTVDTSLVPEASAACIILRHRGRTVGVGLAHADDTDPSDTPLIQNATRLAIQAAGEDRVPEPPRAMPWCRDAADRGSPDRVRRPRRSSRCT